MVTPVVCLSEQAIDLATWINDSGVVRLITHQSRLQFCWKGVTGIVL